MDTYGTDKESVSPRKNMLPCTELYSALKTCDSYILDIINIKDRGKEGSRKHFFKKSWKLMFFTCLFLQHPL